MTAPMFAERLEIRHHDDRVTVLEDVHYWPYHGCVDILDVHGNKLFEHSDVLTTVASRK